MHPPWRSLWSGFLARDLNGDGLVRGLELPTDPVEHLLQVLPSRLRSVLSQAKQEYKLQDEIRTLHDDFPEHVSAKLECEAALELLSESVTADAFVCQDVATECVELLRRYRTFLEQWKWAIRARVVTNLIRDIE